MSDQDKAEQLLHGAYALQSAADNIRYYRDFAPIYDSRFATDMGYCYPAALAQVYRHHAGERDVPIADIGCGTGLVAVEIGCDRGDIDGLDISPDMLQAAAAKGVYHQLIEADLSQGVQSIARRYGALVSAGTFTHGHLDAQVLPMLLDIALPNALFCLGVNSEHYRSHNFEATVQQMLDRQLIVQPQIANVPIYAVTEGEHADDTATVLVYRKAS